MEDIYNQIGKILYNCSPDNAKKIIVRAELFSEGDGGKYQFDFIDNNNNKNWFDSDGNSIGKLTESLNILKQDCIANNLSNGYPIWTGCIVTVDIENSKINIDFKYEPFIEE